MADSLSVDRIAHLVWCSVLFAHTPPVLCRQSPIYQLSPGSSGLSGRLHHSEPCPVSVWSVEASVSSSLWLWPHFQIHLTEIFAFAQILDFSFPFLSPFFFSKSNISTGCGSSVSSRLACWVDVSFNKVLQIP